MNFKEYLTEQKKPISLVENEKQVEVDLTQIFSLPTDKLLKVIDAAKEVFDVVFKEFPEAIKYIPKDKQIDYIKLFRDSFKEGFGNNLGALQFVNLKDIPTIKKILDL